jgi:hypothetical protein
VAVSLDAGDSPVANATLASVNAAFTLSLILTQATSPRQAIRLLTTAVPSIASCHQVLVWHPSRSGDYYERAPDGVGRGLAQITVPGQFEWDGSTSWWAFPLAPSLANNPVFLIVGATDLLSAEEKFLLSVLVQLCGTVIAKLELLAGETRLNADLESRSRP